MACKPFSGLVDEAVAVDVSGWGIEWLDSLATEERPPWDYSLLLAARLARAVSVLDIDTGGGAIFAVGWLRPPPDV